MKRTFLCKKSKSPVSLCKTRIQALLRELAIKRDKVCVLSHYLEAGGCGGYRKDGELVTQAEHLISRSRSISFSDMRNIVLLCKNHHLFWKPHNSRLYWELIEIIIGKKRWDWLKKVEADTRPYKMNWALEEMALTQELKLLK